MQNLKFDYYNIADSELEETQDIDREECLEIPTIFILNTPEQIWISPDAMILYSVFIDVIIYAKTPLTNIIGQYYGNITIDKMCKLRHLTPKKCKKILAELQNKNLVYFENDVLTITKNVSSRPDKVVQNNITVSFCR